jgi:hypothetical protein
MPLEKKAGGQGSAGTPSESAACADLPDDRIILKRGSGR